MSFLNPSSLLGFVLLLYLASFVAFAVLRITTGISIQRIGYCSLRRIAYTPREGVQIELRGLGFTLHRPTFAQPTWISLRLTELKITIDVKALSRRKGQKGTKYTDGSADTANGSARIDGVVRSPKVPQVWASQTGDGRSRTWKELTLIKEKIKRLHEKIHWLCMVDVLANNTCLVVADVGCLEVGVFTMAVDTRRQTVDRGRLFQHKRVPAGGRRPVEWRFAAKGVLFTPNAKDSLEVIDTAGLNIHGLLYAEKPGLRDASISLKLGRVHIPYDDLLRCKEEIQLAHVAHKSLEQDRVSEVSISDLIEELDRPGSREAIIVQTVSDSKEFISSILRGIEEIQIAVNFVGLSMDIRHLRRSGLPLYLNISMNELGIDMHRLDPKSPAHRMYFQSQDVAHQALVAAISLALSLDDGTGQPERVVYVPMATTTVKTTLPSKTVTNSEDGNAAERNANILFANLVVTSPSVDLDPKHMPLVLALLRSHREAATQRHAAGRRRHHLIRRLLPKASVKFSIHEPVIRVVLPVSDPALNGSDEYDLLISSISSISLDSESSHTSAGQLHYALNSSLRMSHHQLYYHTSAGERHNLLITDTLDLNVQLDASPNVRVDATGELRTISVHMVRPEITAGLRLVVQQLFQQTETMSGSSNNEKKDVNFLRSLPPWLAHFQLQGSNFGVEIAGVDSEVSGDTRGVALQLESWSAEYSAHKAPSSERPPSRRRRKNPETSDEPTDENTTPQDTSCEPSAMTDGRRLAVHLRQLGGFVVEGIDVLEPESFLSLPRFEIALSTSSDNRGQTFHLNSHFKSLYVQYSLFRYYSAGVALMVLRDAFAGVYVPEKGASDGLLPPKPASLTEVITADLKAELLQIMASMPSDPSMLLQIRGLEAGRHRWAAPFVKSRHTRLCVQAPKIRSAWARIVSIKNSRLDLREIRRRHGTAIVDERSIDLSAEFVRLAVPHQLVLHNVFDNIANVIKATEQLQHHFRTGTDEYILKKRPEQPKKVPRISLRTRALLFDIEDGPFEWKLGCIYRIGLLEQKQRLARAEAYEAKEKNMESPRHRQEPLRHRSQSSHQPNRGRSYRSQKHQSYHRSSSDEAPRRGRSQSASKSANQMRYDPEGECGLSSSSKISAQEAWRRLQCYNAQSWKKRIDTAYRMQHAGIRPDHGLIWGDDDALDVDDSSETLLAMNGRPGLMSALISDAYIILDKPSFPLNEYPQFLHRAGKGMPRDMEYTLLIPLSVQIDMGEARVSLRDYPLPVLHVPAKATGQSPRLPSWSVRTDFVIAEEYRGDISTKQIKVEVVPPEKMTQPSSLNKGFAIDVRRTVSPVKTYSDLEIAINTSAPTSITWGTSYQPAIQDMMMVIEGFTKQQVDPSDRVGFWDKIRLSSHSRVNVRWKGDGDVHLKLKGLPISLSNIQYLLIRPLGSRDPYVVTGHGAGFVMCWRHNVHWGIHENDDPRQFMTVNSGEYVLAIPDYSHQARESNSSMGRDMDSVASRSSTKNTALFKKVIMKLSGNVRWLAGLVLERNLDDGSRSSEFTPHYDVVLTTPDRATAPPGEV